MENRIDGCIVSFVDSITAVLNKGTNGGVEVGMRFKLYYLSSNDMLDPLTKESLGKLEILVGTGKVINVQEKISTIESDETNINIIEKTPKANSVLAALGGGGSETIRTRKIVPFAIVDQYLEDESLADTSLVYASQISK